MQHKYILHWKHTSQHSEKLDFDNTFINEYTPSWYLEPTSNLNEKKWLAKLRIGTVDSRLADTPLLRTPRYCGQEPPPSPRRNV